MSARSHEKLMILELRESWDEVRSFSEFRNGRVRVTLPHGRAAITKTWRLAMLIFGQEVRALALVRSARWVSDFDRLVEIRHLRRVVPSPKLDNLSAVMKPPLGAGLAHALWWNGVVPPATAREAEKGLERLAPGAAESFRALRTALPRPSFPHNVSGQNVLEQRDAVALALEITGLDSRTLLESVEYDDSRPFLRSVAAGRSPEAAVIRHDAAVFENWIPLVVSEYDVWRFEDPQKPGRRVTILYADKEPLERVTGTDLIYYREETDAFILVQYKRMIAETQGGDVAYRPDKQLDEELAHMAAIAVTESSPETVSDVRLSQEAFYMKLVDPSAVRPPENRLAKGMYFPVSLFKLVRASPEVSGPRGGVRIGWSNAPRYLTNTEFVTLLQGSWIGSQGSGSTTIGDLIRISLEFGHGAVLAVEQFTQPPGGHGK